MSDMTTSGGRSLADGATVDKDACYGVTEDMVDQARKGDPVFQFVVGAAVLDRDSDAVSREEASRLLTSSAEEGFLPSMFYLAALERFQPPSESGGKSSPSWLDRAVELGHVPAHRLIDENRLAWTCESDLQAEIEWSEQLQSRIVERERELAKAKEEKGKLEIEAVLAGQSVIDLKSDVVRLMSQVSDLTAEAAILKVELSQCRRQSETRLSWHTTSRLHGEYLAGLLREAGIPFTNRYAYGETRSSGDIRQVSVGA